jgi:hypothetical protein
MKKILVGIGILTVALAMLVVMANDNKVKICESVSMDKNQVMYYNNKPMNLTYDEWYASEYNKFLDEVKDLGIKE